MNHLGQKKMGSAARDVLLAEALGDLHKLQESINEVTVQVSDLKGLLSGVAQKEMVEVLDQKMNEFKNFQIPVVAASKLQAHAEVFLKGIVAEIQRLVRSEVRSQAERAHSLILLVVLVVGFVSGFAVRGLIS